MEVNLMKKNKMIGIFAISSMMGLSGCNILGNSGCSHQWSPWEEQESSTCVDRGLRERYCVLCGDIKSRSITVDTVNGHRWLADPDSDVQATCSKAGVSGSEYCFYCGSRKKGTTSEKSDHAWVRTDPQPSGGKYHDATCSDSGLYQEKCRDCGATRDVPIPQTDHEEADISKPVDGKDMGIITCSKCHSLIAYQLNITDATGFNKYTKRMSDTDGEESKSVWDISGCVGTVIPEGTYDAEIEALMSDSSHGIRKWYNMARKDLWVTGDDAANTTQVVGSPDDVMDDPYRYFMKVNETNYYPVTKKSFAELQMHVGQSGGQGDWSYCKFVEGLNITKDSATIELVHGNLGYPLYIKSIRFKPHTHVIEETVSHPEGDRVGYTLESCSCPYRKLIINALDGTPSAAFDSDAPEEFMRLKADGDSVTYNFTVEEGMTGNLYMVGKQTAANMDKTPFNISITNNGTPITGDWEGKKASDFLDIDPGAAPDEYSSERIIPLGRITLLENVENVLTITRTGDYNVAVNTFVIEAMPTGHIHKFVHVPKDENGKDLDKEATCYSEQVEHYECSCGQHEDRKIAGTMKEHNLYVEYENAPTCKTDGVKVIKCRNAGCNYSDQIIIPKSHNFATTTVGVPDDAKYEYKECTACHNAREATWLLQQDMIEDYNGTEYVPSTVSAKSGNMSDDRTNFTVFKFDVAKRRVVLEYKHNGTDYPKAMLSIFGTTKASNIDSCQAYQQTSGDNTGKKLDITVNGYNYSYTAGYLNKTIGDLGLENVNSKVNDGGYLADPVWMDYYEVDLQPGNNTIIIETPVKTSYSLYLGGFRLSY